MKPPDGETVAPKLAATVLLVRDGPEGLQVFMVVRHQKIDFASGALVFPGGKVDPPDWDGADGDEDKAARAAALRETEEECGVRLASADDLTLFAHWITPPILPKRFDTRFYIVAAPADQAALHDGSEAVDSVWIEPKRALREGAEGKRTLLLATRLNVEMLAESASVAEAIAAARARRVVTVEPKAVKTETGYRLTIPMEAGYGGPEFDV